MRSSVRALLLVAGVFIAIAWFGRDRPSDESEDDASAIEKVEHSEPAAVPTVGVARLNEIHVRSKYLDSDDTEISINTPLTEAYPVTVGEDALRDPAVESPTSRHLRLLSRTAQRSEPEGDVAPIANEVATGFIRVDRIDCEFGEGFNSAMMWEGKVQAGSASWQGGPIVYDAIDAENGTAQMIGSVGATGSLRGQADTQVALAIERIEFLSRLENGSVILTSVFGQTDDAGRYIAVMSRHEGGHYFGSQFRGSCR